MVLEGSCCRSVSAAAGPIGVISCGVRRQVTVVFGVRVRCARSDCGIGVRWVVGQDAMSVTVMQDEPCRIMARVSGPGMLALVVRAVGTNGQRFR